MTPTDGAINLQYTEIDLHASYGANAAVTDASVTKKGDSSFVYSMNDLYTDASGKIHLWLAEGFTYILTFHGTSQTKVIGTQHAEGDVKYLDGKGVNKTYSGMSALLTAESVPVSWGTADTDSWYVLSENSMITDRITVNGNVNLVLEDHCTLQATKGITVDGSNTLTIYAQSTDQSTMGILLATATTSSHSGIGGIYGEDNGAITINGGTIQATGQDGAGIGGGAYGSGRNITINGGVVTAHSNITGAGIGGGTIGVGSQITMSGGTVTATGGAGGAGIGGGSGGAGNDIVITGGCVKAVGGTNANNIGGGANQEKTAPTNGSAHGSEKLALKIYDSIDAFNAAAVQKKEYSYYRTTGASAVDGNYYFWLPAARAYVVKAPSANTLTYNRSAQQLISGGSVSAGGTMYYAAVENGAAAPASGAYTANIPTALTAGSYDVYYYANGGTDYQDSVVSHMTAVIGAASVSGAAVAFSTEELTYDGTEKYPARCSVDIGNGTNHIWLKLNRDYTISYADHINAGTVKAVVTGIGNYSGTAEGTFTINPVSIKSAEVALMQESVIYTGEGCKPVVSSVKVNNKILTAATDYTVAYTDNVNIGTEAKVTVTGCGNYSGSVSKTFAVTARSLKNAVITFSGGPWLYTGMEIRPAIASVAVDGRILTEGADYEVTAYSNNLKAGTEAKVTVTGKGNYSDHADQNFTIDKAVPTVKVNSLKADYSGAAVSAAAIEGLAESNGQEVPGVFSFANGTPEMKNAGTYGSVTVVFTPGDTTDYGVVSKVTEVVINKKRAVVSIGLSASDIATGAALPKAEIIYQGMIDGEKFAPKDANGDDVIPELSGMPAESSSVGNYTVLWSNAKSVEKAIANLPEAANYDISFVTSASFTISNITSANHNSSDSSSGGAAVKTVGTTGSPEVTAPTGGNAITGGNADKKNVGKTVPAQKNNQGRSQGSVKGVPYITADTEISGWRAIEGQIRNSGAGGSVTVEMNGTGTVPGVVLSSIKGKNITLTIEMDNGITWSINGQDVTSGNIPDIDFTVAKGTDAIPTDIINEITGERYSMNISIAHNGRFGFKAILSVNMGEKNKGLYANLFYFNADIKKLEFMTYSKIADNGQVAFDFEHASDYTIVINNAPMSSSKAVLKKSVIRQETNSAEAAERTASAQNGENKLSDGIIIVIIGLIAVLCLIAGVYFYRVKRIKEQK